MRSSHKGHQVFSYGGFQMNPCTVFNPADTFSNFGKVIYITTSIDTNC